MKALETMIQDMFHKDCAACTDQEVYEALLTYTKETAGRKRLSRWKEKDLLYFRRISYWKAAFQ